MVRELRVKLARSHFNMGIRELTSKERTAIRKLVKGMCANYSGEYGCLLLGDSWEMVDGRVLPLFSTRGAATRSGNGDSFAGTKRWLGLQDMSDLRWSLFSRNKSSILLGGLQNQGDPRICSA